MATQNSQIQSLQILRALAAVSVVYLHIGCEPWFGGFGVDVFFVLSGFVMCYITDSGEFGKEFFLKRIARIVPLYWVLTIAAFILAWLKPSLFNSTTADFGNLLKSLLFIPYTKENGSISPIIPVGWTLNYEMYFYVLITFASIWFKTHWRPIVAATIVVCFLVANLSSGTGDFARFLSDQIALEFVLGIIAYDLYKKRYQCILALGWKRNFAIAFACYGVMALMDTLRIEGPRAILLGLPSSIMLLSVLGLEPMVRALAGSVSKILVAMGDASYATYLSHLYVVEGLRKLVFVRLNPEWMYTPIGVVFSLGLALLVGQCIYMWLDRPLSRALRRQLIKA